jgi:CelD/BcsL family acetyltransferase involved in cellulose biosynthesis
MNTTHPSSPAAEAPAYAQLQREMHDALLAQHPEWIETKWRLPKVRRLRSSIRRAAHAIAANGGLADWKQGNTHQSQYEFQHPTSVSTAHDIQ